jgi:hypothetical protein
MADIEANTSQTTYHDLPYADRYAFQDSGSNQMIVDRKNGLSVIAVCPALKGNHNKAYLNASFITALLNAYERGPISSIPVDETPNEKIQERIDDLESAFHKIKNWCQAYPLDIFEEPDMKKARDVLSAADIEISCIAVSNMRYVLKGIQEIIDPYLTEEERVKINASLA